MGMCVEPLQRRGAMQGQAALWGVQGYLVDMVLEISAGNRRQVPMVLEMHKQLASLAPVWLEALAEMLERTVERSVASGQCFAAGEGSAFVSSFAPDDYSHADDCTFHLDWPSVLGQSPISRSLPPITRVHWSCSSRRRQFRY